MTYYHPSKQAAQTVADEVRRDQRIGYTKVELVERCGWVVVIIPKYIDLTEYGHMAEVRTQEGARLTPKPPAPERVSVKVADTARVLVAAEQAGDVKAPWL